MTLTLKDGTTLPLLGVHGRTMNYEGVLRDSLLFLMDPEKISLEQAMEALTPGQCAEIRLMDETDRRQEVFVHEHYTIRVEVGQGCKDFALSGSVTELEQVPAVYVRMAQSTQAERQLQAQQETLDALVVSALEG